MYKLNLNPAFHPQYWFKYREIEIKYKLFYVLIGIMGEGDRHTDTSIPRLGLA